MNTETGEIKPYKELTQKQIESSKGMIKYYGGKKLCAFELRK